MPEEHESSFLRTTGSSVDESRVGVEQGKSGDRLPRLHLDIFYSFHVTARDLDRLGEHLKGADVYLPEGRGWTDDILQIYREVSARRLKPRRALALLGISRENTPHQGAFAESLKLIWRYQVPIAFADVPRGHPLDLTLRTAFGRMNKMVVDVLNHRSSYPDYHAFLQQFAPLLTNYYEMEGKREAYIVDQLPSAVRRLLSDYPKLRRRRDLRVLLSLGALHTTPYIRLKRLGKDVKRSFSRQPFIFPHGIQAGRTVLLGSGKPDGELVAKAALEMMSDVALAPFHRLTEDFSKAVLGQKRLIDSLDSKEVKQVIEAVLKGGDFRQSFMARLADKGVVLPTTEDELERFIDLPGKRAESTAVKSTAVRKPKKRRSRKRRPPARPARG